MLQLNQPLGIDQCYCFTVRKASRQVSRLYDSYLEPAGVRITQFLTLAALNEVGTAPVNALAERLDIERTAMGKMVGFLERDGFVTIKPSPTDGRSRLVELTKEGQRLHDKAAPLWREAQHKFEELNGAKRVTALRKGLAEMMSGDGSRCRMKRLIEGILGQTKGHSYVTTGDGVASDHSDLILSAQRPMRHECRLSKPNDAKGATDAD